MAEISLEVSGLFADPTVAKFEDLKTKHLIEIGDMYELRLKSRMGKQKLQNYVMTMLVENGLFKADVQETYQPLWRDEGEIEREIEREEKEKEREREREREVEREKERRKKGRKEGRKEGKKEERKEGWKGGTKEGRKR